MTKLTKRQSEVLALIQHHVESTGAPPTRAEIAKTMGFRSPNAAEDHLRALARKGVIELVAGTSRGIRLAHNTRIPLIDMSTNTSTATGFKLDHDLFSHQTDYLLQITDMRFNHLGFEPGDLLAVHKTTQGEAGRILVIQKDKKITLKLIEQPHELAQYPDHVDGWVVGSIRRLLPSPSPHEAAY